jgi:hypothetical protein
VRKIACVRAATLLASIDRAWVYSHPPTGFPFYVTRVKIKRVDHTRQKWGPQPRIRLTTDAVVGIWREHATTLITPSNIKNERVAIVTFDDRGSLRRRINKTHTPYDAWRTRVHSARNKDVPGMRNRHSINKNAYLLYVGISVDAHTFEIVASGIIRVPMHWVSRTHTGLVDRNPGQSI